MNPEYTNNPQSIGNYFSNNNIVNTSDRFVLLNPFSNNNMYEVKKKKEEILNVKTSQEYKETFIPTGTKTGKSCNQVDQIHRFEHPGYSTQDLNNIITQEPFRGGMPSRIVAKDEYVQNLN